MEKFLKTFSEDVQKRYAKALKLIGKDNFTYSKVTLKNGKDGKIENISVLDGFENLPEKYRKSEDLKGMFEYGTVPFAVIEQGDFLNWLVVSSNSNYETNSDELVDSLTLPRDLSGGEYWASAYVSNFKHPEYGLESGSITFAPVGEGFVRYE